MATSLHTPIDAYCERTDASFWSEPINAVTNVAFLIAALIGWRAARRSGQADGAMLLLVMLTACIGIGSFLFHTVATRWAALADVLPIILFIASYLVLAMQRFFGLGWWLALIIAVGLVLAIMTVSIAIPPEVKNAVGGSTGYVPALGFLAVCGGLLAARDHAAGRALLLASGLFVLSLTFRSLDTLVCDSVPLGTHFLWHLLNGAVLAILLVAMARHGAVPEARRRRFSPAADDQSRHQRQINAS